MDPKWLILPKCKSASKTKVSILLKEEEKPIPLLLKMKGKKIQDCKLQVKNENGSPIVMTVCGRWRWKGEMPLPKMPAPA
jgi:hypothetical protein